MAAVAPSASGGGGGGGQAILNFNFSASDSQQEAHELIRSAMRAILDEWDRRAPDLQRQPFQGRRLE